MEEAIRDTLKRTKNEHRGEVTIDGVKYETQTAAARAFGIKPDTLYTRLDAGALPEVAVKLPSRAAGPLMARLKRDVVSDNEQLAYLASVTQS